MSYPTIIQGNNITVVIDNVPHTIAKSHVAFDQIRDAIKAGDWDLVKSIIEPKTAIVTYGNGNVEIDGDTFYWKGAEMHNALSKRMIEMLREGFPIDPLVEFMSNLMENPSNRAVNELYGFLENNNLPITPDGHFLAYKKIRGDYTDCYTGKIDNSVGAIVEMPRNFVDDNRDNTCSSGLHFCSYTYLEHFDGQRVVIVKINPRDVVSIPSDYNNAKGRTCRYEVIGEVPVDVNNNEAFSRSVQSNAYEDLDEECEHCDLDEECEHCDDCYDDKDDNLNYDNRW